MRVRGHHLACTCASASPEEIRSDFDGIAALAPRRWDHNSHYYSFLMRQLPPAPASALDVGCGRGELSRLLAARAGRVVGLDLSPEMVARARSSSSSCPNVEYLVADVTRTNLAPGSFDCISCTATLHHLPLRESLACFASALAPRGALLVLDLYRAETLPDFVASGVAAVANPISRLLRTGRLREGRENREAWARHAPHDRYPSLEEVRRVCREILPGAKVRRHLYWRYSVVWRKLEEER